eukprot:TRINITY_DN35369_c0_g1_i5.p1 TRINITY_DN35369_c0_g1~~TRINITY_DN35369_c0_g1_i5.p1  ORF type:complete len:507 (+),score=109.53 TRINITY_DN35369_c0_g1_i5:159-1679(+)
MAPVVVPAAETSQLSLGCSTVTVEQAGGPEGYFHAEGPGIAVQVLYVGRANSDEAGWLFVQGLGEFADRSGWLHVDAVAQPESPPKPAAATGLQMQSSLGCSPPGEGGYVVESLRPVVPACGGYLAIEAAGVQLEVLYVGRELTEDAGWLYAARGEERGWIALEAVGPAAAQAKLQGACCCCPPEDVAVKLPTKPQPQEPRQEQQPQQAAAVKPTRKPPALQHGPEPQGGDRAELPKPAPIEEQPAQKSSLQQDVRQQPYCGPLSSVNAIGVAEKLGLELLAARAPESFAGRWSYPLCDEACRSFAGYAPTDLPVKRLKEYLCKIMDDTDVEMPTNSYGGYGRVTAWLVRQGCTCRYRYGAGIAVNGKEFPPWMRELMGELMPLCGLRSESEWPNSCNLNIYRGGGEGLGWHRDNEALFQGEVRDCRIISFSLGDTRSFELRRASEEKPAASLQLRSGDLCTMEGLMQRFYEHQLKKDKSSKMTRVNLTWRWIVQHERACPVSRTA